MPRQIPPLVKISIKKARISPGNVGNKLKKLGINFIPRKKHQPLLIDALHLLFSYYR
uniref:Uncharacterized protein n=1 Tax=Siphoviridae sp. ctMAv2 TaxID=2826258 RepID=A0A8S5LSE8_9CAUD|nr:MAG TPA: hypothetical protein [Siphoviridae sp. ctMAv2]